MKKFHTSTALSADTSEKSVSAARGAVASLSCFGQRCNGLRVIVLLMALFCASFSVQATTFNVLNNATWATLKSTIEGANSGDTVVIQGTVQPPTGSSATINLTKTGTLTIRSNTAGTQRTLTMNLAYRHFNVTAAGNLTLTFTDIILDGAGVGGGINVSNTATNLTIDGAVIQNCKITEGNGGAIQSVAAVTLQGNTIITGNTAAKTVLNGTSNASGGGIYITATGSLSLKDNVTISNNTSITEAYQITSTATRHACGGGIFTAGPLTTQGIIEIKDNKTVVNHNVSSALVGCGSGIYAAGSVTLQGYVEIYGNEWIGGGVPYGGGIYITETGSVNLSNIDELRIHHNKSYHGGGIYSGVDLEFPLNKEIYIYNNEAGNMGGGVYVAGENKVFDMYSGKISENTSVQGGGVYISIGGSTASVFNMYRGEISNNQSSGAGGGVLGSILNFFSDALISHNKASSGGGVYCDHTGSSATNSFINMSGGRITGNEARNGGGGGIHSRGQATQVTISNGALIDNNKALDDSGGGIYGWANNLADGGFIKISNATITQNEAFCTSNATWGSGGGIFAWCTLILEGDVTITHNYAAKDGGGIYKTKLNPYDGGKFDVSNLNTLIVSGNSAGPIHYDGGGICTSFPLNFPSTSVVTVQDNEAAQCGGGIWTNSTLHFGGTANISNNRASATSITTGAGGGIYLSNPTNFTVGGGGSVTFSNNSTPNAYWIDSGDPAYLTVPAADIITHAENYNLKAPTTSLSASPAGNPAFTYAYNNYDINYTGMNSPANNSTEIFPIWNWADLAYINTLIENELYGTGNPDQRFGYYGEFVLMQNLVKPGDELNGANGGSSCSYASPRDKGSYGYQNWNGTTYLADGSTLLVGGTGNTSLTAFDTLGRDAWDTAGWLPIGAPDMSFKKCKFDGNHKVAYDVWINRDENYQGLFGFVEEGVTIKDLGVKIDTQGITGKSSVGGLAGMVEKQNNLPISITNCYVSGGTITGKGSNGGGLIGQVSNVFFNAPTTISNCYADVDVKITNDGSRAAGLIGGVTGNVHISSCYATGDISEDGVWGGYIAGLIGQFSAGSSSYPGNSGILTDCYATGSVTGLSNYSSIGGLVGSVNGSIDCPISISNCYAVGAVFVGDNSYGYSEVGGLIGYANNMVSISNCFAFNPSIDAGMNGYVGRIIGRITSPTAPTMINNYANSAMVVTANGAVTPITTGALNNKDGEDIGYTAATTQQSTYSGWNFSNDWIFSLYNSNYTYVTTTGIETNLPILRAFDNTSNGGFFAGALQPPHLEDCVKPDYPIWNWADLAFINTLIDNENANPKVSPKLSDYGKFVLMQDLGVPGSSPVNYGDGSGADGVFSTADDCPYSGDRMLGCYGYQNWITGGFSASNFYTSNTLQVGGSGATGDYQIPSGNLPWITGEGWKPIGTFANRFINAEFDGQGFEIAGLWMDTNTESGLFGFVRNATIKNIGVNISTKGVKGHTEVGGLVGDAGNVVITNCYVTGGSVEGDYQVGGFIGALFETSATVSSCYATILVKGESQVGGLIGHTETSGSGSITTISNCYATGDVEVTGSGSYRWNFGGLIGQADDMKSIITNCYATGTVTGTEQVGGLIGATGTWNVAEITNCFAFNPAITATSSSYGRILGLKKNVNAVLTNNYANTAMVVTVGGTVTPITTGALNNKDGANIGCTATNDENVYKTPNTTQNWDFNNVWMLCPYSSDYQLASGTNLPILKPFTKTAFPAAEQSPELTGCAPCIDKPDYPIWNWADLAYINVLIDNKKNGITPDIDSYGKYVLMQDLGHPNDASTYGDGQHGGVSGTETCPYLPQDVNRANGYYGYENYIGAAGSFTPNNFYTGNTLLVGGTGVASLASITGSANLPWNTGGWKPIGIREALQSFPYTVTTYKPFTGEFEGNGFEINGLWINRPASGNNNQGLFGSTMDATFQNLGVNIATDKSIIGYESVAGLVADVRGTIFVKNCYVTGNVTATYRYVGGLLGYVLLAGVQTSVVENSYTACNITTPQYGGGVIGSFDAYDGPLEIKNCYATGNVVGGNTVGGFFGVTWGVPTGLITNCYAKGNVSGDMELGGFFGSVHDELNIENCFAAGDVTVTGDYGGKTGGFGGYSTFANIKNSYATGTVSCIGGAGGFLGIIHKGADINGVYQNCYATGAVTARSDVQPGNDVYIGGFVGMVIGIYQSTITNCFAFNPSVKGSSDVGRIYGQNDNSSTFTNNYANDCMEVLVNGTPITPTSNPSGMHGEDIGYTAATTQSTYTTAPTSWNFASGGDWTFGYGNYTVAGAPNPTNLPILQAFDNTINSGFFAGALQPPHLDDCCVPFQPNVSISADPSGAVCAGTNVTFMATPPNAGTYQWKVNGNIVANSTSNTYSYTPAHDDEVVCILTCDDLCGGTATATSNQVKMVVTSTVAPTIAITASPTGAVCAGTAVNFTTTITNGGSSPAYQWTVNGTPVGTSSSYSYTPINGDVVK